jgi:hypothetical protein
MILMEGKNGRNPKENDVFAKYFNVRLNVTAETNWELILILLVVCTVT